METETQMSRQIKSSLEPRKSKTNRNSPRLHITLSQENYKFLKEKTPNASKFIDEILNIVRSGIQPVAVVISGIGGVSSLAGVAESGKGARLRV